MMENLDKALGDIVVKLNGLAEAHGAEAVDLAGRVLQLEAGGKLLAAPVFGVIAVGMAAVAWWLFQRSADIAADHERRCRDEELPPFVAGVVASLAALVAGVCALVLVPDGLFRPVVWAAAFDPKVAIAAKVLGAL